ncbi:MAG: phosphoglucosamine mutase [Planctomycetes bacterium]|jgi:phosphomannomutase|nr:phosphoglucosamine mutase [Planctomycetota bacterium]
MEDRLMVSVSGVRGTIGGTLTPHIACDFGLAFARMLKAGAAGARPTVAVGRDTRRSGDMMFNAVAAGLTAGGVDVIDLGVVTTPGAALATSRLKAQGGVVITASHNPIVYNGIKFLQPNGAGLAAPAAQELKKIWEAGQFDLSAVENVGVQRAETRTHGWHVDAVCEMVDLKTIASRRFKVVVDSINGAGCAVTRLLMEKLCCKLDQINGEPTGQFAHTPEPIRENLDQLCQAVRKHGADVGFAQDPDADRLVVVDENGVFIGEEYTLALATAFALSHRKGKVATNLSTSRMIDDIAAAAGQSVVRTPTGEANVAAAIIKHGCVIGGEGNGGVIDPRVAPVRDSLVGMALILQYMAQTGKKLSELAAMIPHYVMVKTKFPCPAGVAPAVAEALMREFSSRKDAAFNTDDGLRIDLPEAWVNVRASNTEPIMRIMGESKDQAVVDALVAQVRRVADAVIASAD